MTNNYIAESQITGLYLFLGEGNQLVNNTVIESGEYGIYVDSVNNFISKNNAFKNGKYDFYLSDNVQDASKVNSIENVQFEKSYIPHFATMSIEAVVFHVLSILVSIWYALRKK